MMQRGTLIACCNLLSNSTGQVDILRLKTLCVKFTYSNGQLCNYEDNRKIGGDGVGEEVAYVCDLDTVLDFMSERFGGISFLPS